MSEQNVFDRDATVQQLIGDEAERFFVYDDATGEPIRAGSVVVGNPTIGIGRNLASKGLSPAECVYLGEDDVDQCAATLDAQIPWWRGLSPVRQAQMVNLDFNMGWGSLVGFHNFLAEMKAGNWQEAVDQLQASKWWHQVGRRGPEIAGKILAG
jgi:lysozyme